MPEVQTQTDLSAIQTPSIVDDGTICNVKSEWLLALHWVVKILHTRNHNRLKFRSMPPCPAAAGVRIAV